MEQKPWAHAQSSRRHGYFVSMTMWALHAHQNVCGTHEADCASHFIQATANRSERTPQGAQQQCKQASRRTYLNWCVRQRSTRVQRAGLQSAVAQPIERWLPKQGGPHTAAHTDKLSRRLATAQWRQREGLHDIKVQCPPLTKPPPKPLKLYTED
jgi:hypothetical protein